MYRNYLIALIIVSALLFSFFYIDKEHNEKIASLTDAKYVTTSNNIKKYIEQSIVQKKQQGLTLALALAQNKEYIDFFQKKSNKVDLKTLSKKLKEYTNQDNVWIHFVSKDGISLYRSWGKKKGDNVAKIRKELPPILKNPQPINLISVGIFDLSFKSIVPVYHNSNFLGIVEVITKVNSITQNLKDIGYNTVVLVDKKYKKQIKKPFTKKFVGDYYVANVNTSQNFLDIVSSNIKRFLTIDDYYLDDKHLITSYNLKEQFDNNMAYFIVFEDLDHIPMDDIKKFDSFVKVLGVFIFLLVVTVFIAIYLYNRSKYTHELELRVERRTNELKQQKEEFEMIFNSSKDGIAIVGVDSTIYNCNNAYADMLGYTREELLDRTCVELGFPEDKESSLEALQKIVDEGFIKNFEKRCFTKDKKLLYINMTGSLLPDKTGILIISKNVSDLKLLEEQSRLASMGEMIGNIAHQWRQPLSMISTGATGMIYQKEYGLLTDEIFNATCNNINNNAQYLSQTIDDFKNFIKGDRQRHEFNLSDDINSFLSLVDGAIKNNEINIHLELQNDINIDGYPNELIQCLINIFNNSKDALKEKLTEDRHFYITTFIENNSVVIILKDNAGGIPTEILPKIFEPYFTTKHQSQGTGLGLSMTYNLIVNGMEGNVDIKNVKFSYNSKEYQGVEVTITLPFNPKL